MNHQEQEHASAIVEPTVLKKSSYKKITLFVLLVLLFACIAVGVFCLWKQLHTTQHQTNIQISQLQKDVSQLNKLLEQQARVLKVEQSDLQAMMQQHQQTESDRTLIEIGSLIKLATFHLTFENNTLLARQLLEAADHRIAADQNPALWPLRQALAQDITMLNAAPAVDLPGLVARLGALSQRADELPKMPVVLQKKSDITAASIPSLPTESASVLAKFKHVVLVIKDALLKLVVVSNNSKLMPSLLTTEQRLYIVTNIQSQLALAEWAAVHRQTSIYAQSLLQVEVWLQRYFSGDSPLVQGMLEAVIALKALSINPPTPNISHSVETLQKMSGSIRSQEIKSQG